MVATSLILAGAVAKGAFEAGVLSVLAGDGSLDIRRVVGASAGALNASLFSAGLRTDKPVEAANLIAQLWEQDANWIDIFRPNARDWLHLRGLGTHGPLLDTMLDARRKLPANGSRSIELRLVLTSLRGETGNIGDEPATTFSSVRSFRDADFDDDASWERICRTALGSAALPVVYAPVDVPGVGPCLDGGLLDNTPVKQAIASSDNGRLIIVCTHPRVPSTRPDAGGVTLTSEFLDILVNERLYRDLRDAYDVNRLLADLGRLRRDGTLSDAALGAVRKVLGWRELEIIEIRPSEPLEGTAISAFSDRKLRERYVQAGAARASAVLRQIGG